MMMKHVLEVLLVMLCVFCISSIGYTEEVIEKQQKTRVIKTPTQSVNPTSSPEYIRTIEQEAASMKAKTKQLTQMISKIKGLQGEQRSTYLEKAVRDAHSLLRHIKAFEKKLGDLHISDSESGMIEADKAKICRHLEEIQEYMSETISITSQSVAAGDYEPLESAAEEPDYEEPGYEECVSNIDGEDCSGFSSCVSCCRDACGDVPDTEDVQAYSNYQFCIAYCRSYCSSHLLSCILQKINESNANNLDALLRL